MNKKEYQELLIPALEQIAEILARGESVEIARSRSGIKLICIKKRHEVLNTPLMKKGAAND